MELTYRYRIYPSEKQLKMIRKTCGCVRYLYNQLLDERTKVYRETRAWADLNVEKYLSKAPFLKEVDISALYWAKKQLEKAYANFFRIEKYELDQYRPECLYRSHLDPEYQLCETDFVGYPRFKKKKYTTNSYTTSAKSIVLEKGHVSLPCIGRVKMKMHRTIPDDAYCMRYTVIEKESGRVFLLVHVKLQDVSIRTELNRPLGVVFDPSHLAVRSDEVKVRFEHESVKLQKQIKKAYQTLKRRKPGSKRYEEQRRRLAALNEKRVAQRWDTLHKESRRITNAADTFYVETPDVRVRKPKWSVLTPVTGRMILDEAWYMFSEMIRYKAENQGKFFWRVPDVYPIYSHCAICDKHVPRIPKQSDWRCVYCGAKATAELNAAKNLENLGKQYIQQLRDTHRS